MQNPTPQSQNAIERSALFVATLSSFLGPFMISAINVALPAIEKDLDLHAVQLTWVVTSYMLGMTITLLPIGKIADIFGRKRIFILGLVLFTLSSLCAGFASSLAWMILCRAVQGSAAGMFITTNMAILTSVFPVKKRGLAIGINASAVYTGLSTGPFVGGLMTQNFGWHSIFFAMVPLGILCIALTLAFLKGEWIDERKQKLDYAGALIYGVAIFSMMYGASILPDSMGMLILGLGVLCLAFFIFHETRTTFPLFDFSLFMRNKIFAFSSLSALLNYSSTFASTFMLSLYLQYVKGFSPQQAGLILMAQPIVMAVFSPVIGKLADRFEPQILATLGMILTVINMVNFAFFTVETSQAWLVGSLLLLGLGFALFSSPNITAIMGSVEPQYYGLASGTVGTMRLLGQMLSMTIATLVLALLIGEAKITPEIFGRFLLSMRIIFLTAGSLCGVGVFFSMFRGKMHQKTEG